MSKSIMITSFKGGVGKSTVAVNLAVGLAVAKYKVLIIDLDSSSGSVDLFMNCEHDTLYNFRDVTEKKVKIQDAVYVKKVPLRQNHILNTSNIVNPLNKDNQDGLYYSLDVLKSPPSYDDIDEADENDKIDETDVDNLDNLEESDEPGEQKEQKEQKNPKESLEKIVGDFISEAKEIYDYVIFDCPSGKFELFDILSRKTDVIFVVTLHSAASIRSAEKLALCLSENGVKSESVRLIINCFNPKGVARGVNWGIVDIIERSKIKLIGLIPINNYIRDFQEMGKTVYDFRNKKIRGSFDDIIGRILDKNIALDKRYNGVSTNNLYFKKEKKGDIT